MTAAAPPESYCETHTIEGMTITLGVQRHVLNAHAVTLRRGRRLMFNPTEVLIDAFVERLQLEYRRMYGVLEPSYPGIIAWAGRMALENIANSDALYHDVEHTLMVTLVGQGDPQRQTCP